MPGCRDLPGTDDNASESAQHDARRHADVRGAAVPKSALQHRGDGLRPGHPSSPYNKDGSLRPAITALRELESDQDANPPEPSPPGTTDSAQPAHADRQPKQGSGCYGTSRGSAMKARARSGAPSSHGCKDWWEGRKKAGQPSSGLRSTDRDDEEGSWRGEAPRRVPQRGGEHRDRARTGPIGGTERELTGS